MSLRLEVLKWEDRSGGKTIVHRVPQAGMADLKLGARCIVQESQAAISPPPTSSSVAPTAKSISRLPCQT